MLTPLPDELQQATAFLAMQCRRLHHITTNLERSNQQLNQQFDSANQQLSKADSTIKELVQTLLARDQEIQSMASSWGWKLMRLWQRLLKRAGT